MKQTKNIKLPRGIRARRSKCRTCVFRPESQGGIHLAAGRRAEIEAYLLAGKNQLCHYDDNKTICRGGRLFQLKMWHRAGIIGQPTDAALRRAMKLAGVKPAEHI